MRYISFSLWGCDQIYNIGAIRNAILTKNIYPEWVMVVYYDETVPKETLITLKMLGVKLIDMSKTKLYGMFWRFLATNIDDCDYVIFRDADSRLSVREKMAVDEWIQSNKSIHIMRDHPAHIIPFGNNGIGIMGGMWGIKGNIINMQNEILKFPESVNYVYGNDQKFLKMIYEKYQEDKCVHDEFNDMVSFPIKREGKRFIGERIDIYENPLTNECNAL